MAASVEQISAVCRANLHSSLLVTKQLLQSESSPIHSLLARMNDVLGGIVESNFGASTYDQLARLYTAIDQLQPALLNKCDDLGLYYFARNLAVVLEEAVRQKEERVVACRKEDRGPRGENEGHGREEYGREKEEKREERVEEHGSDEKSTEEEQKKKDDSGLSSLSSSPPPLSASPEFSSPSTITSASHAQRIWSMLPEEWRAKSKEEMKGLLTIQGVSQHIGHEQLASFLEMMGPLAELKLYPKWEDWPTGFAVCRYENEEGACAALDRLHLKVFFGTRLYVTRVRPPLEEPAAETREAASASDAETCEAASATDAETRQAAPPADSKTHQVAPATDAPTRETETAIDAAAHEILAPSPTDSDPVLSEEKGSNWDSDDDVTPPPPPSPPVPLPPQTTSVWDSCDEVD